MTLAESFDRAAASIREFNAVCAAMVEEFEAKHGPRPKGVPFFEWAVAVEAREAQSTGIGPDDA